MLSCTSSKVSCLLFTPVIGHSTGISCHSHSSHHSIQAGTIHIRICEHVEWETSQVQDHCGEEPLQVIGKIVETGLKRMKVKFATTWNERETIIQKHGYDMIAGTTMYSENLIGIKLNTPVRKVEKPFFIGFAILGTSKHIIYDFYYNVLKNTFDNVELLGQDTDSLIIQLSDKGNIDHKMCEMYKSFDFSELDNTSYFYGQLVNYYEQKVDKSKFPSLSSFLNFNKNLSGPIFKDEHNGHHITEFVRLRSKIYCLVDEKNVIHNVAKSIPRNIVIDGERMNVKNIDLYKRVLEAESKKDAVIDGSFKRSATRGSLLARRNRPRHSWLAQITRDGSWTTMCTLWPLVITG